MRRPSIPSPHVATGGGAGEANTASNIGLAGVGVFASKTGVDLRFKKINSLSSGLAVADNTVDGQVDLTLQDIIDGGLYETTPYVKAAHDVDGGLY